MRQIGSVESRSDAQRFVDYLTTQGVSAVAEAGDGQVWSIWVREEDRVDESREQLTRFQQNPNDPKYTRVEQKAAEVRQQQQARAERTRRQTVDMRERWRAPLTRRAPAVVVLIGLSVAVSLLTGFGNNRTSPVLQILSFSDPVYRFTEGGSPWDQIRQGQIWRLVTPIFLHFHLLHLLFNMWVLHAFGAAIEGREGTPFLGVSVLLIAAFSNALQATLVPESAFGGMSGVVYGLFGYAWYRSWTDPRSGYFVSREIVLFLVFWLLLGFSGALDGVVGPMANWAHAGGLVAGLGIAHFKQAMSRSA